MGRRFAGFLLVFFLFRAIPLPGQTFPLIHFTPENGLPSSPVVAFLEDSRGYLWVANYNGLSLFDGQTFRTFTSRDGLISNSIRCLAEDSNGHIWIGTDAGISVFTGTSFTSFTTADGLGKGIIWDIKPDKLGRLWIATFEGGLSVYSDSVFRTFGVESGLPGSSIYSVLPVSDREIWIGTRFDGIFQLFLNESGSIVSSVKKEVPGTDQVIIKKLYRDNHQHTWIGTRGNGVIVLDQKGTIRHLNAPGVLPGRDVYDLTFLNDTTIIISCFGEGITAIREDREGLFFPIWSINTSKGLLNDKVWSLYTSRENILWIGQTNGFSKIESFDILQIRGRTLLPDDLIYSVFAQNGTAWVTTDKSVVQFSYSGRNIVGRKIFDREQGVPTDEKRAMLRTTKGEILLGTASGLFELKGERFVNVFAENNIPPANIIDLTEDQSGTIWAGTNNGLYVIRNFGSRKRLRAEIFTTADGLISNIIYGIVSHPDGSIWFCSPSGGITVYEKGKFSHIDLNQKHALSTTWDLAVSPWGSILAATNGFGLFEIRKINGAYSIFNFNSQLGLTSDLCSSVAAGSDSTIWVGHDKGVDQIRVEIPENGQFSKIRVIRRLNKSNGLTAREVTTNNSLFLEDGKRLWIGLVEGLTILDLVNGKRAVNVGNPKIVSVRRGSQPVILSPFFHANSRKGPDGSVEKGRENSLFIEYTTLNYNQSSFYNYSYRLVGFDQDWSDATQIGFKEYTNLPGGDYQFMVRSRFQDEPWSPPAISDPIRIDPPFYFTWWFAFISVGFITLVVVGIIQYRTRSVERQNRILEEEVQRRIIDLKKYAEELEGANQALFELSSQKSRLLSVAAHDLRNPLTAISNTASLIELKADQKDQVISRSQFIFQASERMIRTINSLLNLAAIEDGKIQLHKHDFSLVVLLNHIIESEKIHADKKSIKLQLKISMTTEEMIFADEVKIREVIENLISNALKFSGSGTTITLGASKDEQWVYIFVSDQGPGFTEDDLSRVFGRHEKLSAKPTGGEYSSGLGLSIVRELIHLHHGEVSLNSKPGEGAEFTIRLPLEVNPGK